MKKLFIQIPFIALIIVMVIFVINRDSLFQSQKRQFLEKEVSGRFIKYNDLGRGNVIVYINSFEQIVPIDLPGYRQYMHMISIDDSLYKAANSNVIEIYRPNGEQQYSYVNELPPIN